MEYAVYKEKRQELKRTADRHRKEISYHKSQLRVANEELINLDAKYENHLLKLEEEKHIETKLSIQDVADMLATDKQKIEDRVAERKAREMMKILMKGFE
jgi:hypothetical protein